jgi:integrase
MARVKLTKSLVDELPAPESGQKFIWDSELPGFAVRITPTGAKAWIVQTTVRGGKERRMTIGLCSKVPLDMARREARTLIANADLGRDVAQERQDAKQVHPETNPIFEDFSARWLEEVVARRNRPGTVRLRFLLLSNHILPALGTQRLTEIGRKDIEDMHHGISQKFPVAANRAVSTCSAIFATAIRWGLLEQNPALGTHRNAEEGRERYLTPDELARVSAELAKTPAQDSADIVRLLLLTGARFGEVAAMRWEQVDMDAGIWTKPAATTKQNKTHRTPLSGAALSILKKRQAAMVEPTKRRRRETTYRPAEKGNPWVFPGEGENGHPTSIRNFWAAICKRADVQGARIHDLRHTFASLLISAGESLPVVGALLGHTQAKTTSRYAHLMDDALRAATEKITILPNGKIS